MLKISDTKSHSESNGIKVLIHGASGVRKTRSVISLFEQGYKPLFISAESGTKSIAEHPIPMVDISTDDNGISIPLEGRFGRLGQVYKFLLEGKHDFKTIFLDSLTEVNKCLIAGLKAKPEYSDPKSTLKMYGENLETMVKLVRAFRDLPYNVVLVSLSSVDKDDVGRRFVNPDLIGQVANHLPPLFDEVFYLHVIEKDGKSESFFQTQAANNVVAKDRSGTLLPIEPYNLAEMFRKMGAIK